jgi:general secretion pathway protein C
MGACRRQCGNGGRIIIAACLRDRWHLLSGLVAASAVAWGYKLFTPSQPVPAHAVLAGSTAALGADLSRLFGAEPAPAQPDAAAPPPPEASRFQLIGVAAPRAGAAPDEGVALIAVDGKPPRAFRVGRVVDGEQVLLAVHARGAAIGPRNGSATLHAGTAAAAAARHRRAGRLPPRLRRRPSPCPCRVSRCRRPTRPPHFRRPRCRPRWRARVSRPRRGCVPCATPVPCPTRSCRVPAPPQLAQPPSGMAPMAEQPQVGADGRSLR